MTKVEKACKDIASLVSRELASDRLFTRGGGPKNVERSDVLQATEGLRLEDFALLYKSLNEISNNSGSDFCKTRDWAISEGQNISRHASDRMAAHMADYYDNEVSAAHIANREEERAIQHVRRLLEEIEQELKNKK